MVKTERPTPHQLAMWIIWFLQLQAAVIIQIVLGGGVPEGENAVEPMAAWLWVLCFVPIVLATGIRWLLIPRIKARQSQLVALILGVSLAEAAVFFQLFLIGPDYPQNQVAVLLVALFAIFQFLPTYAAAEQKPSATDLEEARNGD